MSESNDDLIVMIEEAMEGSDEELESDETKITKSLKERIFSRRFLFNSASTILSVLLVLIVLRVSFGTLNIFEIGSENAWRYQIFLAFFFSGTIIGFFSFKRKDGILIGLGLMGATFAITLPLLIKLLAENEYWLVDTLYFTLLFLFLALVLIGAYLASEIKDYIKWLIEKRKIINSV